MFSSSSYLSDHSEHKDGHVRRPGALTLPLPLEGGGPLKLLAGDLWEANKPHRIEKKAPSIVP